MKIKIGKIDYEKCHIWWCFRKPIGYFQIIVLQNGFVYSSNNAPYCEKHKEAIYKKFKKYQNVVIKENETKKKIPTERSA